MHTIWASAMRRDRDAAMVDGDILLPRDRPRKVLVCFDFEGHWGMPFAARYDLQRATEAILECLARHHVSAVFFIVGQLALERAALVKMIAAEGHELALHGWRHEHLDQLTPTELANLGAGLAEAEESLESASGKRPTGFRAPYLLSPLFFRSDVYELLEEHGYRWASNREIRYGVELLRPDRIHSSRPWRFAAGNPDVLSGLRDDALILALNAARLRREFPINTAARWVRAGLPPFFRRDLLEIPVYTPLDCDLVGCPAPSVATPEPLLAFAEFALRLTLARPTPVTMLTFHEWIVSGGNRLRLLDGLLASLDEVGARCTTVAESWNELLTLATSWGAQRTATSANERFRTTPGAFRAHTTEGTAAPVAERSMRHHASSGPLADDTLDIDG